MRIIHIIPSLQKGGAERLVLDICIELSRRSDVEVLLIAFDAINHFSNLSSAINCRVVPAKVVPSLSGKWQVEIENLMQCIQAFKPDVIHSHLFRAEMVSRYALLKGVKYFTHCHDNMRQFRKFSFRLFTDKQLLTEFYERHIMLRQYKRCNNSFVAISNHTLNYFKKVLPLPLSNNVYLLHNAINFHRFNSVAKPRAVSALRLINVGSFNRNKNQDFLIDVVQVLLAKGHRDVLLSFCGTGATEASVQQKVRDLNLTAYVKFFGATDDVETYLGNSNIYVHSAKSEALGLTHLEAMAAGLPVVCLDGGGNRDVIEQNKNGIMIFEHNAEAFANAILQIADNEAWYRQMCLYAVEYARKFDIEPYVDKLLELYKN